MEALFSAVPWNTPDLWQAANASLATAVKHMPDASRILARRIRCLLEQTFPLMDRLCRHTCPSCLDVCCSRAWVWIDFKDLLFIHLAGLSPPERQLLSRPGNHCFFAGPEGCRLNRIQRPFICTWYQCPTQARLLKAWPRQKQRLTTAIEQIKAARQQMEDTFIQVLTRA